MERKIVRLYFILKIHTKIKWTFEKITNLIMDQVVNPSILDARVVVM